MDNESSYTVTDDAAEPSGLVPADAIREALGRIPDEHLQGDVFTIREYLAQAVGRVERNAAWREGLVGAGLDSPAGRRVLSAVRLVVAALDLPAITANVRQARNTEDGARTLAQSLTRIDRAAAAELDCTVPDVLDVYQLRTGAIFVLPRDPAGTPLYWDREAGRLKPDNRRPRDWCLLTIGEVEGASWKKARIGTANTIPEAESICRRQPRGGDLFQRALEAEVNGAG